jgi:hypothetical protein
LPQFEILLLDMRQERLPAARQQRLTKIAQEYASIHLRDTGHLNHYPFYPRGLGYSKEIDNIISSIHGREDIKRLMTFPPRLLEPPGAFSDVELDAEVDELNAYPLIAQVFWQPARSLCQNETCRWTRHRIPHEGELTKQVVA